LPTYYYAKPKIEAKNEDYIKPESSVLIYNEPMVSSFDTVKPRIDARNDYYTKSNSTTYVFDEPFLKAKKKFYANNDIVRTARSTQQLDDRLSQDSSMESKTGWMNTGRKQRLQSYEENR
jgi:hypothetical protein